MLVAKAAHPKVIGIGETGLDYFRLQGDLEWQRERFRTHIRAAQRVRKPLVIHTRAASADTMTSGIAASSGSAQATITPDSSNSVFMSRTAPRWLFEVDRHKAALLGVAQADVTRALATAMPEGGFYLWVRTPGEPSGGELSNITRV